MAKVPKTIARTRDPQPLSLTLVINRHRDKIRKKQQVVLNSINTKAAINMEMDMITSHPRTQAIKEIMENLLTEEAKDIMEATEAAEAEEEEDINKIGSIKSIKLKPQNRLLLQNLIKTSRKLPRDCFRQISIKLSAFLPQIQLKL